AAAAAAVHFGARQDQGVIIRCAHRILDRRVEARPPGAAVEFGLRAVERQIAGGAAKHAGAVLVVERTGEWALRALLAQHLILRRGEEMLPLVIGVRDFEGLGTGASRAQQGRNSDRGGHAGATQENIASGHVGLRFTSSAYPTIARAADRARN